jgi:hypothetical protein
MDLDELRQRAQQFEIFGWEEMGPAELREAVETAEQEAPDAGLPLQREVARTQQDDGGM